MMRHRVVALACAALFSSAQACGPDFYPDVFVRTSRPDLPPRYAGGRLGILQTGFASADLFVAFRYLNGGGLTPGEQKGWSPTYSLAEQYYGNLPSRPGSDEPQPPTAITSWTAERALYRGAPKAAIDPNFEEKITTPQGYSYNATYSNCADDAFRTAAATLKARAATWGASSPTLLNWLEAQDAVFAACSASVSAPQPVPAGSLRLLQQDRAYQLAAAHFYSRDFDAAEQEFQAIAADKSSPWSNTAGYVAARVLIRKSFLSLKDAQAPSDFEPASMQAAGRLLRAFLATDPPPPWKRSAEAQLALVRIRLEPETRTRELAALLAGPGEDPNYKQDIKDLLWVMGYRVPDGLRADAEMWDSVKAADGTMQTRRLSPVEAERLAVIKRDKAYQDSSAFRAVAPILDWTITLRALSSENAAHALAQWKQTRSLPWLIAALMLAPDNAAPDSALLQAAAAVRPDSPAWETASYHRARLQIAAREFAAARSTIATLQSALDSKPSKQQEPSTRNALRGLVMRVAGTRGDVFAHLSRRVLLAASETSSSGADCAEVMKHRKDWHHCLTPDEWEVDTDAARLLNEQAPLSFWIEAAKSASIPQPLRRSIAMQGWTRAILLGDTASAIALQPLLPEPLRRELSSPSSLTPWVVLARNPGLQPYVDRGIQRAYSYDFVENYRLNWCYNPSEYVTPLPTPFSLTTHEFQLGQAQFSKLSTLRAVDVGQKIIAAVEAEPSNSQAPESLYLVLRMIRYGCNPIKEAGTPIDFSLSDLSLDVRTGEQLLKLRRDAGRLLRRHYAKSPWTRKAAPFVGEVHPPA